MADTKVANSVVALSSAVVLAVYGAGYARTRAAADRFAQQAADRRPHIPTPRGERDAAALDVATALPTTSINPVEEGPPEPEVAVIEAGRAATPPVPAPRDKEVPPPVATTTPAVPAATKSTTVAVVPTADEPPPIAAPEGPAGPAGRPDTSDAAAASVPAPPAPVASTEPAKQGYKDGTFYGWGTSRHGDIQAAVVIESGRITVARVEQCLTRYSCNWITPIPPRILTKQGTTYDYVSGATESSDAFQDAVAEALSQAK